MSLLKPPLHPRVLAHLGDAVYELWVREAAVAHHHSVHDLHRYTTQRVKAQTQADLLEALTLSLTNEEQDLVRRAQNMPVTTGRRSNQALHRKATALEALIGYWYLSDPEKLPNRKAHLLGLLDVMVETSPGA